MLLLFHHENQIASLLVNNLLAVILEHYIVTILHSSFYVNIESFVVCNKFVATANRAYVLENSSLPIALTAVVLHLHLNRPHLHDLIHYATSSALGAYF